MGNRLNNYLSIAEPFLLKIIFIILIFLATSCSKDTSLEELMPNLKKSVVTVLTFDGDNNAISQGTGFFIDHTHIITNFHVIEGAERIEIKDLNNNLFPVRSIVGLDSLVDIVKLTIDINPKLSTPVKISTAAVKDAESVIVIGSPIGLEHSVSNGLIASIRSLPPYGTIIQLTAPISSGSSGSPVFDSKGEVIGIATFQVVMGQNLNFAIPIDNALSIKHIDEITIAEFTKNKKSHDVTTLDEELNSAVKYQEEVDDYMQSYKVVYGYYGAVFSGRKYDALDYWTPNRRNNISLDFLANISDSTEWYKINKCNPISHSVDKIELIVEIVQKKYDYYDGEYWVIPVTLIKDNNAWTINSMSGGRMVRRVSPEEIQFINEKSE